MDADGNSSPLTKNTAMQKRRSHKKSRNGCQNCKKWHTKCDEQGPPCNNCTLRKAVCVYTRPRADNASSYGVVAIRRKDADADASALRTMLERPRGDIGALCGAYGGPARLLELELMHQWSTKTYQSFCGIPEDHEFMQVLLPRAALNYDFMLNCIMAISSLHVARSVGAAESARYVNAGLELYNKGSISFRTHLTNMNADNCLVLYMFSAIAVAVHLSSPRGRGDALRLVIVAFDLVSGSTSIGMMGMPWMLNSAYPLRVLLSRLGAPKELIDADSRAALARLRAVNDLRYGSAAPRGDGGVVEELGGVGVVVREHEFYEMVIDGLEMCFAEEARGLLTAFCTAFPGLAGKHYTTFVSRSDPFSLLILMHWGVLLSRLDSTIWWWASSIATDLTIEAAVIIHNHHPDLALEWAEPMAWVQQQVGLSWPSTQVTLLSSSSSSSSSSSTSSSSFSSISSTSLSAPWTTEVQNSHVLF
ncbi:hypothetical protein GGS23DRAFT_554627 [Durotheca rogersii]|uniref:uncharacterized protein n=1 Tax=Durotheca rogersii TaxID=419775 RepID=UPI00221E84DE|nr:uncharacterized protein GGS23DRAFT_554627 [Durotheca rogersii]KAI5865924.1 hypothetical protein GGS23DRAFT_554627 [Durotheca rogersii]